MIRLTVSICLLALCAPAVEAGRSDPAKVDSLLDAAADSLLDRDRREALMKRALRHDRSGRTMHALARFYMAQGTPVSRQTAGHWLLRAVMRERENPDYRATHAELLWRTLQRPDSYRKALQVLELDPDHVAGLFWAGRFAVWAWEYTYFTEMPDDDTEAAIGMYSIRGGKTLTFVEYPDLGIDTGIGYLSRAISVDPVHWPSHQYLGLSYYAADMPGPLIELFETYRQRRPENWNAHFFAGLGYQMKGDLERAYRAYLDGLNRMTESSRRFMQSIFLIMDPAETKRGEPPAQRRGNSQVLAWKGPDLPDIGQRTPAGTVPARGVREPSVLRSHTRAGRLADRQRADLHPIRRPARPVHERPCQGKKGNMGLWSVHGRIR